MKNIPIEFLASVIWQRSARVLQVLTCAAMLAGCSALPVAVTSAIGPEKEPALAQNPSSPPIGKGNAAVAPESTSARTASVEPIAPTPKEDAEVRMTKPFASTVNEVKAMIVRADPEACSVLNDSGAAQIAATYAKLANVIGTDALRSASAAELQAKLKKARPFLREISVNTNWLPRAAERMVANYLYKRRVKEFGNYSPQGKHQTFVNETFRPIFEELARYARTELKSDMPFDFRMLRDQKDATLSTLGGGIILVPSGFVAVMTGKKNADQVVAFQLAHEFSHILRAHYTKLGQLSLIGGITTVKEFKNLTKDAKLGAGGITDLSQMFNFSESNVNSLMGQVCRAEQWMPSMQQDQEYEGDVCGVFLLHQLSKSRGSTFNPVAGFRQYLDIQSVVPENATATGLQTKVNTGCRVKTIHPAPAERMGKIDAYHRSLTEEASR